MGVQGTLSAHFVENGLKPHGSTKCSTRLATKWAEHTVFGRDRIRKDFESMLRFSAYLFGTIIIIHCTPSNGANAFQVAEDDERIVISSPTLEAVVRKKGYVSGVAAGSFLDKKSGFRDAGYGLDIVDWIMEPGSDEAYRDQLKGDLAYLFNNAYHGKTAKRSIEGPQICTQAKMLSPRVVQGKDFVAVTSRFKYQIAAPGKRTGSEWSQVLVFPAGQRYFISSDKITSVNASDAMFLRIDMPGHIKHKQGDTFSEIDSIEEMEKVYDRYAGHTGLEADEQGWKLTRSIR